MRAPRVGPLARGVALLALSAFAGAAGDSSPSRRRAYASELPAGPGRALTQRSCVMCHSAMLINQQRKDSTGWEKTIAQMEAWGVALSPAEHDTLRRYLVAFLGPRSPQ